ncbi:unnamed protein product [Rhizophagus irregularis]|nr:unnamed protein product [Rhizophagus irregularis]
MDEPMNEIEDNDIPAAEVDEIVDTISSSFRKYAIPKSNSTTKWISLSLKWKNYFFLLQKFIVKVLNGAWFISRISVL